MPELPEIHWLSSQLQLCVGKRLDGLQIRQEKILNKPPEAYQKLIGSPITQVRSAGKWLVFTLDQVVLGLHLGMGAEMRLHPPVPPQPKAQLTLSFTGDLEVSVRFWWFGYFQMDPHALTRQGPDALLASPSQLEEILSQGRGRLKTFLLNQANLAGVGNYYIHDILFLARLHPHRPVQSLTVQERHCLIEALQRRLGEAVQVRGASYERDLYGAEGGFGPERHLVAYLEGEACPECHTQIEKLKTGSTASFICSHCQI